MISQIESSLLIALSWLPSSRLLGDPFAPENLVLLVWGGLAMLTLALLILMLTRFGHVRPLSKCIALSVFAHAIFFAYAYCTKLILDVPPNLDDRSIRVKVLAADEDWEPQEASSEEAPAPWDQFASQVVAPPMTSQPDAAAIVSEGFQIAAIESNVEFEASIDNATLLEAEREDRQPELVGNSLPASTAAPSDVKIESAARRPTNDTTPLSPVGVALPRQGVSQPTTAQTPSPPPPTESPEDWIDAANELQRLAEQDLSDRLADAVADLQEMLQEANNQAATQDEAGTDDLAQRQIQGALDMRPDLLDDSLVEFRAPEQPPGEPLIQRRLGDGALVPDLYTHRTREDREPLLQRYGGTPQTEDAVAAALAWLAANQGPDGRWDASLSGAGRESRTLGHDRHRAGAEADTAITGLALLALMGSGHTHFEGTYRVNIQKGLEYLVRSQQDDGNLAGRASLFARMYCHGIATLALSEAYAVTGDHRLTPYVERAIGYTLRAQHPTTGGWRYQPGDRGDTSQFGWQVMALKSASLAGIQVPAETRGGMLRFLRDVSSGMHGGRASYRRGERATPAMTAEALACRFFLDRYDRDEVVREATDFILTEVPGTGQTNLYYWYYGTLALFQAQGPAWQTWNLALQDELLQRQRKDGHWAGSWDPDTVWGGYGGRIYSTAMATLCLEVYYRYLPVYESR